MGICASGSLANEKHSNSTRTSTNKNADLARKGKIEIEITDSTKYMMNEKIIKELNTESTTRLSPFIAEQGLKLDTIKEVYTIEEISVEEKLPIDNMSFSELMNSDKPRDLPYLDFKNKFFEEPITRIDYREMMVPIKESNFTSFEEVINNKEKSFILEVNESRKVSYNNAESTMTSDRLLSTQRK